MKIGQAEFFIGAVGVVIIQSPAEQQTIDTQPLAKVRDDRDRAPLADEDRRHVESLFNGFPCGCDIGTIERYDDGFSSVSYNQLDLDARWTAGHQEVPRGVGDLLWILIRNQAKAEFGAGPRGNCRLAHLL